MLFVFLCLLLIIILATKLYSFVFDKPPNVPPGPPRLPIWGSYWFFLLGNYQFPHQVTKYFTNKYKSKLISCYFGDFFTIIASDYESVKEVLKRKEFDGRLSESYVLKARFGGKRAGIFFNDGPAWSEQRRFALRHMRDFGFGRRFEKLENDFADEVTKVIDTLKYGAINDYELSVVRDGRALFPNILYPLAANSLFAIFIGERLPRAEHGKFRNIAENAVRFQRSGDATGGAIALTPWLRHFVHDFGFSGIIDTTANITDFIREYCDRCKIDHIEEESRGFVDKFIEMMKEVKGEDSTFTEEQLHSVGTDFLFPALTTTPWVVSQLVKFMMHHPRVLAKVQNEIDTLVGKDRLVNLNDRVNMPYTEATIREAMRCQTLAPWAAAHRTLEQTELCGYTIPKNTVIVPDLWCLHNDPDLWGDPENFRPERFITEGGKLGKDHTLPFGAGGRLCAAETFARQIMFLVFVNLVQNFKFAFVEGEPSLLDDNVPGILVGPKEFWVKIIRRD